MHNVKIDYYVRENNKVGTHSLYPVPIPNGTYGFQEICEQASQNTTIEADTIMQAVNLYMKVAQEKLCDGFRVEVGKKFLTLGPNLKGSVKDYKNDKGELVVVTAKDLTANKCKSRVSATVHPSFSNKFEESVGWRKTDKQGNAIEEEDATETNEELANGDGGLHPTSEDEFTLTVNAGTGVSAVNGGGTVQRGESHEVSATVSEGYTFDGWYNGDERVSQANPYTLTMPAANLTLEARATQTGGSGGDNDSGDLEG